MIEPKTTEIQDLKMGGWTLKARVPESEGVGRVIVLNHGWTGDERSMWVFANQLPKDAWLIAPRAPYFSKHPQYGGYSWVESRSEGFSALADFSPAIGLFLQLLKQLSAALKIDLEQISLMGFSQGAAFNYAMALQHSHRVKALAALAGFAPQGAELLAEGKPLHGKSVFIAHGKVDETVPVELAYEAREIMQLAGADVKYCQSNVGHKLGANCFRELKTVFVN